MGARCLPALAAYGKDRDTLALAFPAWQFRRQALLP
jgi:hypothetical protein